MVRWFEDSLYILAGDFNLVLNPDALTSEKYLKLQCSVYFYHARCAGFNENTFFSTFYLVI